MRKNYNSSLIAFTIYELVVIMSILSILWSVSFRLYGSYLENIKYEEEILDSRQLWFALKSIINTNWDIPLNYCRNSDGSYDSNCFTSDPLGDWFDDDNCDWTFWDLTWDVDCDSWCVFVDCSIDNCWNTWDYFDVFKLVEDEYSSEDIFLTSTFISSISYRICPFINSDSSPIIGKWMESRFNTFNPSFTLFYDDLPLVEYNSNP